MENNEKYSPQSSPEPVNSTSVSTGVETNNNKQSSKLTTALIVMIVVLLFLMLIMSMNGSLLPNNRNQGSDLSPLISENGKLRSQANAERIRQGLQPLPVDAQNAQIISDRIQRDATSLVAISRQWQSELDSKESVILELSSELKARDAIAKTLYTQISELQSKLSQAGNAANALLMTKSELERTQTQIENYRNQLGELQMRPSNDELALLQDRLTQGLDERNKLQLQIDALIEKSRNKVDSSKADALEAELAKLRPELNIQRYEIQRLRALLNKDRLFIESESDLPQKAAALFAKLRTLEDANEQQILAAYQNVAIAMGAEVVHRQNFSTGSAQITFDREKIIQDALNKRQAGGSYFLVVGYASQSGGAENNRKLSAERATTVASVVDTLKAADQTVQAVYLGETDRFSAENEAENQICEVWEIKK
ncbi:MAG: OmpA family protein [Akkermansiaceae bacterium]